MHRLGVMILAIAVAISFGGCGCNDDRHPSYVWVELADPLAEGSYDVIACVDEVCDEFVDVGAPGTSATAESDIEIRLDAILITPWARAIEPGEHRVEVLVVDGPSPVLSFDGRVSFQSNGRCYDSDSNVTIRSESLNR